MKKFKYLGLLLILLGILVNFIIPNRKYTIIISIFIVLLCFIIYLYSATKRLTWQCEECGYKFKINILEFILGINVIDTKLLYCQKCHKRTNCKALKLDKTNDH